MERNRARRWTALIDRMADGDREACAAFYDESSVLAYRLLTYILPERDIAEDALVDLYRNVQAAARRNEHRNRNPLCWLVTLARDTAARHQHRLSETRQFADHLGLTIHELGRKPDRAERPVTH